MLALSQRWCHSVGVVTPIDSSLRRFPSVPAQDLDSLQPACSLKILVVQLRATWQYVHPIPRRALLPISLRWADPNPFPGAGFLVSSVLSVRLLVIQLLDSRQPDVIRWYG